MRSLNALHRAVFGVDVRIGVFLFVLGVADCKALTHGKMAKLVDTERDLLIVGVRYCHILYLMVIGESGTFVKERRARCIHPVAQHVVH